MIRFSSLFFLCDLMLSPIFKIMLYNFSLWSFIFSWKWLLIIMVYIFSLQKRAISKFIESYLFWKLPWEKYGLKPDHPFVEDYTSCQMAILPENFFSEVDKGMIQFKKTSKWWFWSKGLEFEDNTRLEADVVVLATGFDGKKKLQSLLPEPFSSLMVDSSGIMPLYR